MRSPKKALFICLILLVAFLQPPLAIIPQVKADESDTWQVSHNSDDAYRKLTPDAYDLNLASEIAGYWKFGQEEYGSGLRFTGISIPKGSTIISANITFTAQITNADGTPRTRISGYDADNPSVFSTSADFDARYAVNTDAVVDWDIGAWVMDSEYTSPDIKTVIQELIDRSGWSSGNAMVLFWEDFEDRSTHVDNSRRHAYSHDSDPTKAPILSIHWTIPTLETPSKLFGAGFNGSNPVVHLYWNTNHTGITLFEVQNSTDKVSWTYLGSNTTAEYHDLQVVNGTERYYRVRACNFTGGAWDNSTWSDINFEKVYFISEAPALAMGIYYALAIILLILGLLIGIGMRRRR